MATPVVDIVNNNGGYAELQHALESTVNGYWYEILRRHFPFPGFIIAPEYYNAQNGRIDLCVLETLMNGRRPVFSFEGKHGGTPTQFWHNIPQAANYLPQLTVLGNGRRYGMLAAGRDAIILEYQPGGQQVLQVTGPNLPLNTNHNTQPWDVSQRANDLDGILTAIHAAIQATP